MSNNSIDGQQGDLGLYIYHKEDLNLYLKPQSYCRNSYCGVELGVTRSRENLKINYKGVRKGVMGGRGGEGGKVFALSSFATGAVDSITRQAWEQTGEERGDGHGVVCEITQNQ